MPQKPLDIVFPSAGVVRRSGLSVDHRGPFPTPWATNVRLEDTLTNRLRGGSFTGIASVAKSDPVYRDRLIEFSGTMIQASRQGDHTDFSFSSDVSDSGRAVLWQLSEAGSTGGTVVSVVPHKDSHLLCFTSDSIWVLSGDPATGSLRRISDEVGIIGVDAWCINHDTVYFLSSSGLYSVQADGSGLQAVSEDRVPEDLTGITDTACVLTYNHSDRGVYITLTSGVSWFYDTAREGFWPYDLTEDSSHVLLGPFRLGTPRSHGRILNLHGVIATDSDDVTWRIVTGDSAEDAAANGKSAIVAYLAGNSYTTYVKSSGTWEEGRNHMVYPRIRAVWCCIWLASSGDWAYEKVAMTTTTSGRWK